MLQRRAPVASCLIVLAETDLQLLGLHPLLPASHCGRLNLPWNGAGGAACEAAGECFHGHLAHRHAQDRPAAAGGRCRAGAAAAAGARDGAGEAAANGCG